MKNISLLLFAGVIFLASCQKEKDAFVQQEQQTNNVHLSSWRGVGFTANGAAGSDSLFYSAEISDATIDSSILSDGVVLVYSKENNNINTLPFGLTSNIQWNYEIKNGSILISANTTQAIAALNGWQFAYVVVPEKKIASLEDNGISLDKLINYSFTDAEKLFAGN
ncbi:MAG: hypothetical protein ACTHMV_17530 [Chitinophagaceae bacterium]